MRTIANISILANGLRRRVQCRGDFKIMAGLNWLVGSAGAGKTTCIDILKNYKNLAYQNHIKTDLCFSSHRILHVDFEFLTCSEKHLEDMFKLIRSTSNSGSTRVKCMDLIAHEIQKTNAYDLILVDNTFCLTDEVGFTSIMNNLSDISKTVTVVGSVTCLEQSLNGNVIQFK